MIEFKYNYVFRYTCQTSWYDAACHVNALPEKKAANKPACA